MLKLIGRELWHHIPYTAIGAVIGIVAMIVLVKLNVNQTVSEGLFYTFHPLHLLLSAIVTTSLYMKYKRGPFWLALVICYAGPVVIGTLSDAIIPYAEGNTFNIAMNFEIPFVAADKMPFLGIPEWIPVNAAVIIGIAIGMFKPKTHLPHMSHILISTWATLLYFTSFGAADWLPMWWLLLIFLFIAVWIPCCFSDIVFPLLWSGGKAAHDHDHEHHDHDHGHNDEPDHHHGDEHDHEHKHD
jgi:hypothetical protein